MLTPRVANCSSISSKRPAVSSGSSTIIEVLSLPVGAGKWAVRDTSTNRVTALGLSPIPSASTVSSWCSVIPGGATAASASAFSKRDAAAATFDVDGMCPCVGKFASSHTCVCAYATGCALMIFTSARVVPGRATSTKFTGTRYSPMMRKFGMFASASCVALTPPSIEFSIAIIAATLRPCTTSSSASPTLLTGCHTLPAASET